MKDQITITDLGEACALYQMNFPVIGIKDSENSSLKDIIFEEINTELGSSKDILDLYRKDKLMVNARTHFLTIKALKHELWLASDKQ